MCQTYRDHVIMACPSFDTAKVAWRVQADISWCADTRRDSVFVRFRGRGKTEADAVHRAIQNSLDWIDRRLFCYPLVNSSKRPHPKPKITKKK